MSRLLISDWTINRFARVTTTMEDASINERAQAGLTPYHGVGQVEMKAVVARHTAWSKTKGRCG